MGKFLAMHKYLVVFLALVACHVHESLLTQGRKLKPLNTDTTLPPLNVASTPSSEKKLDSPMIPKYEVEDSGANTNAFRPTSPGDSPGAGHKSAAREHEEKKALMVVVQSPDVKVYVTEGSKNDFAPTTPGHSPGVGHAYQNKNGQN